jgi:hypothetical protein
MAWHSVTMRTGFPDLEIAGFMREITAAYVRELSSGLKVEYRLYRRMVPSGEHIVMIPPNALHLAEQTPTWGKQLKQLSALPNLTGFSEIKLR